MQDWLVAQVRAIETAGNERRAALRSPEDARAYAAEAQRRIVRCFGALPEKTPLNPRIAGGFERESYRVENVIFESRPGFLVTANLYLPKGRTWPAPAVLGACGHANGGKAGPTYQSYAQGLVKLGFVVLVFDPIGLGERNQYVGADFKPLKGMSSVREHLHAGNQQFLVGENFATWNLWDGIRALDYLLSRPEVDARHVGVTGNSGGGTMTTWLCAIEPRLTMAAPGCFVTTLRRNAENELPVDTEQCVPRVLGAGLDHSDFLVSFAPRPLCPLGQEGDFFDVRGFEEACARVRDFYRLIGAEKNFDQFSGGGPHGYSQENREAMYRFFSRATGQPAPAGEPPVALEPHETLQCAPSGQVAALHSRTVFAFTRERAQQLARERGPSRGERLQRVVQDVLKLPPRVGVPEFRILRNIFNRGYPKRYSTDYAVETEPPAVAIVLRQSATRLEGRPARGKKRAILYVAHRSSDTELREEPLVRELIEAEPQSEFFACDVRGIGDSMPNTCGTSFDSAYGSDYFYAVHGVMLERPYVGQKTHDVLRVLDWLQAYGHDEVHLVGRGWGALPATFAALLSPQVVQVTLKNALTSYAEVATTEHYSWPLSTLLPGVLKHFDLPDCYRELEAKRLVQIEPWGAIYQEPASPSR